MPGAKDTEAEHIIQSYLMWAGQGWLCLIATEGEEALPEQALDSL